MTQSREDQARQLREEAEAIEREIERDEAAAKAGKLPPEWEPIPPSMTPSYQPAEAPRTARAAFEADLKTRLPAMPAEERAALAKRAEQLGGIRIGFANVLVRNAEVLRSLGLAAVADPSPREAEENKARLDAAALGKKYRPPAPRSEWEKMLGRTLLSGDDS